MCIHLQYKPTRYLVFVAYMPNLVVIPVSSLYLAITCEAYVVVHCVLAQVCKYVGSMYPFSCWLCDLHLQYGSLISSVIYAKFVYSDTRNGHLVIIWGDRLDMAAVEV